jgi:hypothetical protein
LSSGSRMIMDLKVSRYVSYGVKCINTTRFKGDNNQDIVQLTQTLNLNLNNMYQVNKNKMK